VACKLLRWSKDKTNTIEGATACITKTLNKVSSDKPHPGRNIVSKKLKRVNDNELTAEPITVAVTSANIEQGIIAPVIPAK